MSKPPQLNFDPPWKDTWWTPAQRFPSGNIAIEDRMKRDEVIFKEDKQNEKLTDLVPEVHQASVRARLERVSAHRFNELCQEQDRARGVLPPARSEQPTVQKQSLKERVIQDDNIQELKKQDRQQNKDLIKQIPEGDERRELETKLEIAHEIKYGTPDRVQELEKFEVHRQKMVNEKAQRFDDTLQPIQDHDDNRRKR